jgi:hypothetical protein
MGIFGTGGKKQDPQPTLQLAEPWPVSAEQAAYLAERERDQMRAAVAPGDVEARATDLMQPDWSVQREAAVALARAGDGRGMEWFARQLQNPDPGERFDAVVALGRVMLSRDERLLSEGLNINAMLGLHLMIQPGSDPWCGAAASWYMRRVPICGSQQGLLPLAHLSKWNMLYAADEIRAGRIPTTPETPGQLAAVDEVMAEVGSERWTTSHVPGQADAPAAPAEVAPAPEGMVNVNLIISGSIHGSNQWVGQYPMTLPLHAPGSQLMNHIATRMFRPDGEVLYYNGYQMLGPGGVMTCSDLPQKTLADIGASDGCTIEFLDWGGSFI